MEIVHPDDEPRSDSAFVLRQPESNALTEAPRHRKAVFTTWSVNPFGQIVHRNEDGSFVQVAVTANGTQIKLRGRWSVEDNVMTVAYDNQQTIRGTIKIVNKDRMVFHDPVMKTDINYDRIVPK